MNKNSIYVYKKTGMIILLASLILFTGCRSNSGDIADSGQDEEFFLSRPKIIIDTPVTKLPYTLKWEGSKAARSYEIQSAFDQQFTDSRQNWTTRESFLLLEELKSEVVYIRIRARFDGDYSRWSEVLMLTQDGSDLKPTWLRA